MAKNTLKSSLSNVCTILLGAMIVSTVLFSGTLGGNTFNFYVTALFVAVATVTAFLEKKPFTFPPEVLILTLWLCYSIIPSLTAENLDLAYDRTWLMVQIVVLTLLSINVILWHGKTAVFALLYCASGILAYVAALSGFGFGIIDESLLRELNSQDRIVGTHGNANQFSMVCLMAQIAALFYGVQTENRYARILCGIAITILSVAIINTGSRTAFVGMIVFVFGLIWIFRVWKFRYFVQAILMTTVVGLLVVGSYYSLDEDHVVKARMDSYLENRGLMNRYENLLRLFVSYGDVDSINSSAETSASTRAALVQEAWRSATRSPLGLGLDNFRVFTDRYAHSNYFELLATTGFPGLVLYLAIYILMLRRLLPFLKHRRTDTNLIIRVYAVGVLILMVTDIADVSYYDKTNWLFIALAISSMELCRKSIRVDALHSVEPHDFAYEART